jgi:hypothetical protein
MIGPVDRVSVLFREASTRAHRGSDLPRRQESRRRQRCRAPSDRTCPRGRRKAEKDEHRGHHSDLPAVQLGYRREDDRARDVAGDEEGEPENRDLGGDA